MQISTWRPHLKKYLEKLVPISSFDLRQPIEYEEWICFLPPLASMGFVEGNASYATAVQDIVFSIRYRADTLYIELPLDEIEGFLASVQLRLVREYQAITELSSCVALTVANPIRVEEYGDGMADWLITVSLAVELGWTPEPESNFDIPLPRPIEKLVTGLYTEHLTPLPPALKPPESHLDPRNRDKFGEVNTKVK